jgi:hypothetical protein
MTRQDEIREQIRVLNFWRAYLFVMYGLHYVLGVAAVALSVIVAGKPASFTPERLQWLAIWLAGITSVIAFISPERVGERYQRAYRVLSVEVTRYLSDTSYGLDNVLKAYERGEDFIHSKRGTE